ncbi:MAG: right-handed parallel beta-helix repeat-containing protein, partial [Gemmatimonadaceae bacterium]|nr:right-handed parallel beta-helix repeat-containing protein [Gemmatimonadaceae bacterium]
QNAAIRTGDNWVMQDCIVEKHAGGGMAVTGVNTVVRRIIAQDNGRYGIGGSGGRNILVQDCITRRNNRTIGDSNGGGGKFTRLDGAVIERLQAYENGGVGLWLDINNINVTVRDSEFHDNVTIYNPDGSRKIWGDGIDIEISGMVVNKEETAVTGEGPVVLENSRFWNNEHDGILAYASRNVIIRNNTVTDDHIYIKDGGRAPWGLSKLTVTGNTITRGFIQADGAVVNDYQSKEIVLDNNTFITSPILYKWSGTSYRTLDAVRTALGYELEGTVK